MKKSATYHTMKKIFILLIAILSFFISFSQESRFPLNRPFFKDIESIEKVNKADSFRGSTKRMVAKDYFPNADKFHLANPLIYIRKDSIFYMEINYYFSLPDSIVRLVSYSWDGNKKQINDLKKLFNNNISFFSKYFEQPGEITGQSHQTWQQQSIAWQNDAFHVNQFMVLGESTYRVRVLLSWK